MPSDNLQLILGRAVTELAYRELLFLDLAKALEGYALTDREVIALQDLSREKLDALANEVQVRLSQAAAFEQRLRPAG